MRSDGAAVCGASIPIDGRTGPTAIPGTRSCAVCGSTNNLLAAHAVLAALRKEFSATGRLELFDSLEPHLWEDDTATPYATIAESLEMTVVAVRVTLHRLRQRFHELLCAEISNTVETQNDVDDELRHLRRVLAG